MKYMGSKNRIAKDILPIMLKYAEENGCKNWVEPFVGGGNMIDKVPNTFNRIGFDINNHLISALSVIRDTPEILPEIVTEEDYLNFKRENKKGIGSWVRYVCSFAGKFDAGYAREQGSDSTTFALRGKKNALKQSPLLKGVTLICKDYKDIKNLKNCLIYCDPPYKNTTGYNNNFNHDSFYEWCRLKAQEGNIVFVSEYFMPDDFKCVWQGSIKTCFDSNRKSATNTACEKLFILEPTN